MSRMTRCHRLLPMLCMLAISSQTFGQPVTSFHVGMSAAGGPAQVLPDGWQPLTFKGIERHTRYELEAAGEGVVVKAVSQQSASGLVRPLSISPREYPVIEWRWKIENILQKGDVTRKSGDDYPARIYITFSFDPEKANYLERMRYRAAHLIYGPDVPYRAITYIWGSNSQVGERVANAYTDRVVMYVVESGDEKLQRWVTERRNVYDDYRQAFGEEPFRITGVAIMTDTDNTQESATAWYGDINFLGQTADPD